MDFFSISLLIICIPGLLTCKLAEKDLIMFTKLLTICAHIVLNEEVLVLSKKSDDTCY